MAILKNFIRAFLEMFKEKETAQTQTTTTQKRTYNHLTVTDEGTPVKEGGRRYYLDSQVINYLLVQETDLTVKSEIRTLIKEKEAEGVNAYGFETKLGRYEIVNGTFKRYPKT